MLSKKKDQLGLGDFDSDGNGDEWNDVGPAVSIHSVCDNNGDDDNFGDG